MLVDWSVVDKPEMLTSREVAKLLGVSLNTLQKWRSRATGPKFFKFGGANSAAIRYDKADVLAFRELAGRKPFG